MQVIVEAIRGSWWVPDVVVGIVPHANVVIGQRFNVYVPKNSAVTHWSTSAVTAAKYEHLENVIRCCIETTSGSIYSLTFVLDGNEKEELEDTLELYRRFK